MTIARVLAAGADLFLGARCPGCGGPGLGACPGCRAWLGSLPVLPVRRPGPLPPTWARGPYRGRLRDLILAFKERQGLGLTPLLGDALLPAAAALLLDGAEPDGAAAGAVVPSFVVPIPSAPARVRERGFDVTGMLAARLARRLREAGVGVRAEGLLVQRRRVRDQGGLGAEERRTNLVGALHARRQGRGEGVLLVDDIVTTGATLGQADRAATSAGFRVLGAVVLADTRLRRAALLEGGGDA